MSAYPSHTRIFVKPRAPRTTPYREPPSPPPPPHYDYAAAVARKEREAKRALPFLALIYGAILALVAIEGERIRMVETLLPPAIALVVVGLRHARARYSFGRTMNGWFSPKRAVTDAVIAGTMSLFMLGWFGQVLGRMGSLALIAGMFGIFQLIRFMNAQLATLEWARLQESGRDEKKPVVAMPRAGYRDLGEREEETDADLYEKEIPRRRRRARIALGIIGAIAAALVLVPGIAFGAWLFPEIIGVLALTTIAFRYGMRLMQRGQARPLPVAEPRVRIGVDFGVPQTQLAPAPSEEEELELGLEREAPRRRSAH